MHSIRPDALYNTGRTDLLQQERGKSTDAVVAGLAAAAPRVAQQFSVPYSCVACHSPNSGLPIPPLTDYRGTQRVTQRDTGARIGELARVSHIRLFGISMFFLMTGAIFSLSETPVWLRISLVVIPYLAILADIGSWSITKFDPLFRVVVVVGGAFQDLALAGQILIRYGTCGCQYRYPAHCLAQRADGARDATDRSVWNVPVGLRGAGR